MEGRNRPWGQVWIAALAVGVAALAMSGLASGKLKERSVAFTIDGFGETTAACKRGQEAVAGGFSGPAGGIVPYASARDGGKGWRTRLYSGGTPANVTAYVYCDKKEPGLKVKSVTEMSPLPAAKDSVTATCGRNKEAVSGGFNVADSELTLTSSKRVGTRSWEVGYIASPETPITAVVLCDKPKPKLKTRQVSESFAASGPETVVAKCKRKQELRSGGFDAEYNYPSGMDSSTVSGSRKSGKGGWEVAVQVGNGEPTVTAYAYCDKKKRKK
jgi:hypothetical protein